MRNRLGWLVLVLVFALTGCGSAATGRESPDAVVKAVTDFAGPGAQVYRSRVLAQPPGGELRWLNLVVGCKPGGGCVVVAPDGATYPDLEAFVEDTELLQPGTTVRGNAAMATPGADARSETFTKSDPRKPVLLIGGGVLLVLVLAVGVWLVVRARHRRRESERLLRAWDESAEPGP